MITTGTRSLFRARWWLTLALVVCLMPGRAVVADEQDGPALTDREFAQLREVLKLLDRGMGALNELDRRDMAEVLGVVVREVRGQLERAGHRDEPRHRRAERTERQVVEERLEVLRLAIKIVREAEQREVAEQLELAIHAHEFMLEGRRGEEALEARRRAPKTGQTMELLGHAAHLYREFEMPERAEMILRLREELWPDRERRRGRDRDERERTPDRERPSHLSQHDFEAAANRIEIMRLAMPAILERGRKDTAELIELAIRGYEVMLEGRKDREARNVREHAPSLGQQVEILMYAAKLWEEFGDPEKAHVIAETAEHLREHLEDRAHRGDEEGGERDRDRTDRHRNEERAALINRLEELQAQIGEIKRRLERLGDERR